MVIPRRLRQCPPCGQLLWWWWRQSLWSERETALRSQFAFESPLCSARAAPPHAWRWQCCCGWNDLHRRSSYRRDSKIRAKSRCNTSTRWHKSVSGCHAEPERSIARARSRDSSLRLRPPLRMTQPKTHFCSAVLVGRLTRTTAFVAPTRTLRYGSA